MLYAVRWWERERGVQWHLVWVVRREWVQRLGVACENVCRRRRRMMVMMVRRRRVRRGRMMVMMVRLVMVQIEMLQVMCLRVRQWRGWEVMEWREVGG